MLFVFLTVVSLLFASNRALELGENRPGAIPILSGEVSNVPGGWIEIPAGQRAGLNGEIDRQIKALERGTKKLGAPRHKLIRIRDAISQVVAGVNKKVVFTVGQLNETPPREQINEHGQYGECYFSLFFPLGSSESELKENRCVKTERNQAE